jgi:hypothetical protein
MMTRTNWLILGFWSFIGIALIWQFMDYNSSLDRQAEAHPVQTQFFFYKTNTAPVHSSGPTTKGPDVRQISYWTEPGKPSDGMFTAHIVAKNVGMTKATGVQILVRPYRGISMGDVDNGRGGRLLSDDDPLAQFGEWVDFVDLAPGQSDTETVSFSARPGFRLGGNPKPEIIFGSDKDHK